MVEVTRREKSEEEKKVIDEVRKTGAQWMGEEKMEDVAKLCLMFMKNEDNLNPPEQGFKGANLFKEYMYETLETRKLPKNSKFKIKKNKRTHITNDGVIKEIL